MIFIYEFIKYINFFNIIKSNLKIYQKIINLFRYKNVSDFRKYKLIINYSKSLFVVSIKIITILLTILVLVLILNLQFNEYLNLLISILGIVELSIVFIIYHLIRKKLYAKL